jgi:hypothetical protein
MIMEKDDLIRNDELGKMLQGAPLEQPSDTFVGDVMAKISISPEIVRPHKPFFLYVRNSWPYALISLIVLVFLYTSDLPYGYLMPGKGFFTEFISSYFSSLFSQMKLSSGTLKNLSIPLMIAAAVGLLLVVDHWVSRKPKAQASILA